MLNNLPNETLVHILKYALAGPVVQKCGNFGRISATSWHLHECAWAALSPNDYLRDFYKFIRSYSGKNTSNDYNKIFELIKTHIEKHENVILCNKFYIKIKHKRICCMCKDYYRMNLKVWFRLRQNDEILCVIGYLGFYYTNTLQFNNIEYKKKPAMEYNPIELKIWDIVLEWIGTYGKFIALIIVKNEKRIDMECVH
jgi:hypothetical protein